MKKNIYFYLVLVLLIQVFINCSGPQNGEQTFETHEKQNTQNNITQIDIQKNDNNKNDNNKVVENNARYWVGILGGGRDDWADSVLWKSNGKIIASGEIRSSGSGGADIWLVQFDTFGNIEWQKTYGSSDDDHGILIKETSDNGLIVTGVKRPAGSFYDYIALKLNNEGNIVWGKTIGGYEEELLGTNFIITRDGGVVFVGSTRSYGAGGIDIIAVKLDINTGNAIWQKTIGTSNHNESSLSVLEDQDGTLLIGGWSNMLSYETDSLIIRLDPQGNVVSQKLFDFGPSTARSTFSNNREVQNYPISILKATDGNYFLIGEIDIIDDGFMDIFVMKVDSNYNIIWQKIFGGSKDEFIGNSIISNDGAILITGATKSFGAGDFDIYVLKLDTNGNILMQKIFGSSIEDNANRIFQNSDGDIIIGGGTRSFGRKADMIILKMSQDGNIENCNFLSNGGFYERVSRATSTNISLTSQDLTTQPRDISFTQNNLNYTPMFVCPR